jgi:hypothetical protein
MTILGTKCDESKVLILRKISDLKIEERRRKYGGGKFERNLI